MRAPLGVLIAAAALVAGGCGGSKQGAAIRTVTVTETTTVAGTSPPSGGTTTSPAPGRTTPARPSAPGEAAAQETAEAAALRLEDLPSGWTAEDVGGSGGGGERCWLATGSTRPLAEASTATFTGPANRAVNHTVLVFARRGEASRVFAALRDPELRGCLASEVTEYLRRSVDLDRYPDAKIFDAESAELGVAPYGAESGGFRITVPVFDGTTRAALHSDWVVIRAGAAISLISLVSAIEPPEEAFRDDVARTAAMRLRDATGG